MVLHDHIDKVIDSDWHLLAQLEIPYLSTHTILITNKHFAIQDLVIAEDVVQHLLVEAVLGRRLEGNFHATSFFGLQVDIPVLFEHVAAEVGSTFTHGGSLFNLMPTASSSASSRALCSALFVASKTIKIMSLVYR